MGSSMEQISHGYCATCKHAQYPNIFDEKGYAHVDEIGTARDKTPEQIAETEATNQTPSSTPLS